MLVGSWSVPKHRFHIISNLVKSVLDFQIFLLTRMLTCSIRGVILTLNCIWIWPLHDEIWGVWRSLVSIECSFIFWNFAQVNKLFSLLDVCWEFYYFYVWIYMFELWSPPFWEHWWIYNEKNLSIPINNHEKFWQFPNWKHVNMLWWEKDILKINYGNY